jgi:hypothetical protein
MTTHRSKLVLSLIMRNMLCFLPTQYSEHTSNGNTWVYVYRNNECGSSLCRVHSLNNMWYGVPLKFLRAMGVTVKILKFFIDLAFSFRLNICVVWCSFEVSSGHGSHCGFFGFFFSTLWTKLTSHACTVFKTLL